eukprot:11186773-Lingulodinium_polyedra.AAC.1
MENGLAPRPAHAASPKRPPQKRKAQQHGQRIRAQDQVVLERRMGTNTSGCETTTPTSKAPRKHSGRGKPSGSTPSS